MVTGGFLWQMICNFALAHSHLETTQAAVRASPQPATAVSAPGRQVSRAD
jgi:hypothetical protein